MDQDISDARDRLGEVAQASLKEYAFPIWIDNLLYNWGLAIAILLNTFATVVPSEWGPGWIIAGRFASGIATAWIAIDRALQFGPRWQFGMSQRNAYRSILAYLHIVPVLADRKKQIQRLNEVFGWIQRLHEQDAKVPGIGTVSNAVKNPEAAE